LPPSPRVSAIFPGTLPRLSVVSPPASATTANLEPTSRRCSEIAPGLSSVLLVWAERTAQPAVNAAHSVTNFRHRDVRAPTAMLRMLRDRRALHTQFRFLSLKIRSTRCAGIEAHGVGFHSPGSLGGGDHRESRLPPGSQAQTRGFPRTHKHSALAESHHDQ
jgi:hypothetical protein